MQSVNASDGRYTVQRIPALISYGHWDGRRIGGSENTENGGFLVRI